MAEEEQGAGSTAGDQAPQALDAATAASPSPLSAVGAIAPLDNVVSLVGAAVRRAAVDAGSSSGKTASGSAPPPPLESAIARPSGDGGSPGKPNKPAKAEKPEKKTERTIDWGKLNHLIENFVLIYGTDTVWDASEQLIMKIANMGHAHGSEMVRMWKNNERRRTVRQTGVVFDPTDTCDPETTVNLYSGMAMEPKKGDVEPILDLVRYLTSRSCDTYDGCDDVMHWMLCWLAYPLQNPGAKLRTSIVMHGDEGAGKNFLFDMVVAIYGKYGALVGQDELEDKFNDWRSCKLFVVGDEVSSRAELVHNKNRLKALITSTTVQINPKNLPRREEANHINIVFLSNELQPLALDNSDRRYLVVYTPRAKDFSYYKQLGQWREAGGIEAFYHYLLNYPLKDFDPYSPAPMTDAKTALIGLNRKSPELFWAEWRGAELDLPYMACSVQQLYSAYLRWCVRTGERYPFKREQFTPTVLRFAEAQGEFAQVKAMNVTTLLKKKTVRMYLVAEPDPSIAQGEWASSCVSSFDDHLRTYFGNSRSHDAGDNGKETAE